MPSKKLENVSFLSSFSPKNSQRFLTVTPISSLKNSIINVWPDYIYKVQILSNCLWDQRYTLSEKRPYSEFSGPHFPHSDQKISGHGLFSRSDKDTTLSINFAEQSLSKSLFWFQFPIDGNDTWNNATGYMSHSESSNLSFQRF